MNTCLETGARPLRSWDEVSWKTVLIVPELLRHALDKAGETDQRARTALAEDALTYGYRFVCMAPEVYEVVLPQDEGERATLRLTRVTIENGDFVAYIIVNKALAPLVLPNGQLLLFVNPETARFQAARNAGEVLRLDDFFKRKAAAERSKIIFSK